MISSTRSPGVRVRETVPDRIMQMADELEVVDLPPEELLARFSEGKVYIPPQAEQADTSLFSRGKSHWIAGDGSTLYCEQSG